MHIDKPIVSPLNYMGGKKKLLADILSHFPDNIGTFVDLFCGGATIGINTPSEHLILNDNLPHLTELFQYLSENPIDGMIGYIEKTIHDLDLFNDGKEAYNSLKQKYNSSISKCPLDLFILIAFGFNNQIRFNSRGEYNIPFGQNRRGWNPKMKENFIAFANALQNKNVEFLPQNFADFDFSCLKENDFVYCDPPYLVSFATYNPSWNENEEKQLLGILSTLNDRKIKFALSNALENKGKKNEILIKWIEDNGFKVYHFNISYKNSAYCRKEKGSVTDEVLVTNY